jgi:hypothetical protein
MRIPARSVVLVSVLSVASALAGCGPDCRESCHKIFGDGAEDCNINPPGLSDVEIANLEDQCVSQCANALANPGAPTYDPNERNGNQQGVEMITDQDAARWMDCVTESACDYLNSGYCAPTTNF